MGRPGDVLLGLADGAVEPDRDGEADGECDADRDGEADGECDADRDGEADGECDADRDGEADGDRDGDRDGEADGECEGDLDGDGDIDGECDGDGDIEGECDGDIDGDAECDGDGDIDGECDGECDGDGDGDPLAGHVCVRLKNVCGPSTSASAATSVQPAGVAMNAFDVPCALSIAPPSVGIVFVVSAMPSPFVSKCRVSDWNVVSLPGSTNTQTSWSGNGPPPKFGSQSWLLNPFAVVGTLPLLMEMVWVCAKAGVGPRLIRKPVMTIAASTAMTIIAYRRMSRTGARNDASMVISE